MHAQARSRTRISDGSAILMSLMVVIICAMVMTMWLHLVVARSQQSASMVDSVKRHTAWSNAAAINQQHAFSWSFRDGVAKSGGLSSIPDQWGSVQVPSLSTTHSPFRSARRPANSVVPYTYNNLRVLSTADQAAYYERTASSQDDGGVSLAAYSNVQTSYPAPFLGDLMLVHKRPAGVTGTLQLSDNIRVDGRVVVWDDQCEINNVRARQCYNLSRTSLSSSSNWDGSATLMPQNWNNGPFITSGYSSTRSITDGTLNMVHNTDFPAGSISHMIQQEMATQQYQVGLIPTVTNTVQVLVGFIGGILGGLGIPIYETVQQVAVKPLNQLAGDLSNTPTMVGNFKLNQLSLPGIDGPALADLIPPLVSEGNQALLKIQIIMAHHPDLTHVKVQNDVRLVIVLGQLVTLDLLPLALSNTANMPARMIWVDQSGSRPTHVLFIGESNRRLLFVTGKGTRQQAYCAWVGLDSLGAGLISPGVMSWRMNWINENTHLQLIPPLSLVGRSRLEIKGSLRTDWSVNTTDGGSAERIRIIRDTSPADLLDFMPRDAWLQTQVHPTASGSATAVATYEDLPLEDQP